MWQSIKSESILFLSQQDSLSHMDMEVSVPGSGFGEDGMSVASVEVVAGITKVRVTAVIQSFQFLISSLTIVNANSNAGSLGSTNSYRHRVHYVGYWRLFRHIAISARIGC